MPKKAESYEDMMLRLEEIVTSIESSKLTLEESMKAYENGVKLINKLYKTLNTYEGKIKVIKNDVELEVEE